MILLDLFAGRLGWSKAFLARGWKVIAFDLVLPPEIPEGVQFIQRDVLDVQSFHFGEGLPCIYPRPDFIVASSPCEQFSVHGMKHFHPNPPYPELGIKLFNHTRSLCEASGVPYVMENVRAAQQFVGYSTHHCGPWHLWGNAVPPFLPKRIGKGTVFCKPRAFRKLHDPYYLTGSNRKSRDELQASVATVPHELANCIADYAERLATPLTDPHAGE